MYASCNLFYIGQNSSEGCVARISQGGVAVVWGKSPPATGGNWVWVAEPPAWAIFAIFE